MIGLGWLAYVRADYRDSANNESHFLSKSTLSLLITDDQITDRTQISLNQK
jgi:hypothetical protein